MLLLLFSHCNISDSPFLNPANRSYLEFIMNKLSQRISRDSSFRSPFKGLTIRCERQEATHQHYKTHKTNDSFNSNGRPTDTSILLSYAGDLADIAKSLLSLSPLIFLLMLLSQLLRSPSNERTK